MLTLLHRLIIAANSNKGMLDPIIIGYKLTENMSVIYYRIQQYPVKYIYNKGSNFF